MSVINITKNKMRLSISSETDLNQKERKSQYCRFAQSVFNENVKKNLLNF